MKIAGYHNMQQQHPSPQLLPASQAKAAASCGTAAPCCCVTQKPGRKQPQLLQQHWKGTTVANWIICMNTACTKCRA